MIIANYLDLMLFNLNIEGTKRLIEPPGACTRSWLCGQIYLAVKFFILILALFMMMRPSFAQIAPDPDPFSQLRRTVDSGALDSGALDSGPVDTGIADIVDNGTNNDNSGQVSTRVRRTNAGVAANQQNADQIIDDEALATNRNRAQRSNIRAGRVEPGTNGVAEDDPYLPTGIQIGSLRLNSYYKQSIGYSSNKQSAALGEGGGLSLSEVDFQLRSQWSRHELAIGANGTYEKFFDGEIDPDLNLNITANLRLDLIDGFRADIGSNYNLTNEAATSPSLTQTTINEPAVHNYGAFMRLQREGRKINSTLRASISRNNYEDAKLSGGGTLSQSDRNLTIYGLQARLAYQSGLAYSPFVQASYSSNVFDEPVDRNGQRRDSTAFEFRGGFAIDIGEKINGELSTGYVSQEFVDPALVALAGFVINGNLNWSPNRDTNIILTMGSNLGGSTTAGDSGAITHNGELAFNRRIRDDLLINGSLGLAYTNYQGLGREDLTYTAQLGFEHWLNRSFSVTGEIIYENLASSDRENSFDAATFLLGVKYQR